MTRPGKARPAVKYYVAKLREERLAREMEEGYKAEARSPSLEPEWLDIEIDAWP